MRRSTSPREMIAIEFTKIERMLDIMAREATPQSPADLRRMTDTLRTMVEDARGVCVDFAAAMPALDAEKFADRIDQSTPDMMARFIEKHLDKQIPILKIAGADPQALKTAIVTHLAAIDEDIDLDIGIQVASSDVVDQFPDMHAPDYHRDVIETLMREALGLEGTPPALEAAVDAQKVQAMRAVRMVAAAPLTYAVPETDPQPGF